jgi:hypothetical protein
MAVPIAMGGIKGSILLSLILFCAILTGCLGEKESVEEELDGDDLLEWWVFRMGRTSYELDDGSVIEMNDGDSVFFEYPAPMPADYLLQDGFVIGITCNDGLYAENGMPIPLNEEDTLTIIMRNGNGEILFDEDDFPCDNDYRGKGVSGKMGRYWDFQHRYSYTGAYHSADEAYSTFENDPEVSDYESVYPITIEITAQTAGGIPGVSEDNSLKLTLENIEYKRWDPDAFFSGNYTVDECESLLNHEH